MESLLVLIIGALIVVALRRLEPRACSALVAVSHVGLRAPREPPRRHASVARSRAAGKGGKVGPARDGRVFCSGKPSIRRPSTLTSA